jgi:hypothetical protein
MDLSKLPKMSQTAQAERERAAGEAQRAGDPPAAAGATARERAVPGYADEPVVGAEVWISAVLGLVFVVMGWNFARYLIARGTGQAFHTGVEWSAGTPKAGQEVGYFELQGYTAWTDASMFVFGLAMLADGALLLASRRASVVWAGFALTVLAVAMNLVTAGLAFSAGIMPLFSIVAVAIGGYMLAYQWRLVAPRGSAGA